MAAPVSCPICSKKFSSAASLNAHIDDCLTKQPKEVNGKCPVCNKEFPQSSLMRHVDECLMTDHSPVHPVRVVSPSAPPPREEIKLAGQKRAAEPDSAAIDMEDWGPGSAAPADGWEDDGLPEEIPKLSLKRSKSASSYIAEDIKGVKESKIKSGMPVCPICKIRFPEGLLALHVGECLSDLPSNSCPLCFQPFDSAAELTKHSRMCQGQESQSDEALAKMLHDLEEEERKSADQAKAKAKAQLAKDEELARKLMEDERKREEDRKRSDARSAAAAAAAAAAEEAAADARKPARGFFSKDVAEYDEEGKKYTKIDTGADMSPSQSWRGQTLAVKGQLTSQDGYTNHCFKTMIQREKEHCGEYFVFYHSYSFPALIYEVQSCLARCIYNLPAEFAALPRLLKGPFDGKPCLDLLMEDFKKMGDRDHNPAFRALAISANASLFATGEGAPVASFKGGYSCSDLSFIGVLTTMLTSCGLTDGEADTLAGRLVKLGAEYGLCVSQFGKPGAGAAPASLAGHMLQIFLHKSCIDDIAYASQPYGVLDPTRMPLSKYLGTAKCVQEQVRIFVHPTLFMDPDSALLFHYPADAKFSRRRMEFQKRLEAVLESILGTSRGRLRAFQGIEGIKSGGGGGGKKGGKGKDEISEHAMRAFQAVQARGPAAPYVAPSVKAEIAAIREVYMASKARKEREAAEFAARRK